MKNWLRMAPGIKPGSTLRRTDNAIPRWTPDALHAVRCPQPLSAITATRRPPQMVGSVPGNPRPPGHSEPSGQELLLAAKPGGGRWLLSPYQTIGVLTAGRLAENSAS